MNKFANHPEVLEVIKRLEDNEKAELQKDHNKKVFEKQLEQIMKDKDYKTWLSVNDCKFYDSSGKFGYFHFYSSDQGMCFQLMREVDDFIYIPIIEKKYEGQTIKELIAIAEGVGKK